MHGAAGAGLALQLHQLHRLTKEVLLAVGGPVIHVVGHGTGGGDGVDGGNLGKGIAGVGCRLVAIHGFQ